MRRRSTRRVRRRRLIAAVGLAAGAIVATRTGGDTRGGSRAEAPPTIRVQVAGKTVARVPPGRRTVGAVRQLVPSRTTVEGDNAEFDYVIDRRRTALAVATRSAGAVEAVSTLVGTRIPAPVLRQALRNSCETAALSILLAANGIRVDQRRLQAELPRSGPLDPQDTGAGRIWGDPDLGYVGRADGTGTAGGFGVYPGPIRALAIRHGLDAEDLTSSDPAILYERLRAGHAVMAWVGLGDGPYGEWTSEEGKSIRVNYNEHTVVLDGIRRDGSVSVSNPLEGTREVWSQPRFESMWALLGRRAIG